MYILRQIDILIENEHFYFTNLSLVTSDINLLYIAVCVIYCIQEKELNYVFLPRLLTLYILRKNSLKFMSLLSYTKR